MKRPVVVVASVAASVVASAVLLWSTSSGVRADDRESPERSALASLGRLSFTTLITTPRAIEGLTNDGGDNLYLAGSGAAPCPIWKVDRHNPMLTVVGYIPAALASTCTLRGLAFDQTGNLMVSDAAAGRIYALRPDPVAPPDATIFAAGVPGSNGLAFDPRGALWTSDGSTGQGRVWKILGAGANCVGPPAVLCQEVFRVQPMRNGPSLGGNVVAGVGRQVRDFPPATTTIAGGTFPLTPAGGQDLVANGLAFDRHGDLLVMDTARGALWKVELDHAGGLISAVGCDTTFTANTLCLHNLLVAHPVLEGGDGIAIDRDGDVWVAANERNAIAVVSSQGQVVEVFRNPPNAAGLRNAIDAPGGGRGNSRILEFPTSPILSGRTFCTANADTDRRDNSPAAEGEINGGLGMGKISCLDQRVPAAGVHLPVR